MGFWDNVRNFFNPSPKPSTSTTEPKESSTITTQPAQKLEPVRSIDYSEPKTTTTTSGGVTTTTTSQPTGITGGITVRGRNVWSGGGGGGSSQPTNEVTVVSSSYTPQETEEKVRDLGYTIKPASSQTPTNTPASQSVTPVNDPYSFPQRYNRPFLSGVGELAGNLNPFSSSNTYGLIGSSGLGTWVSKTFYSPFEYVGNPNNKINIKGAKWRGTDYGTTTPGEYKSYSTTEWDIYKNKNMELWNSAKLPFNNEPPSLLPLRLQEKTASELKEVYGKKQTEGNKQLFDIYQKRIETGELTLEEAQGQYNIAAENYNKVINEQFNLDLKNTFTERYKSGGYESKITELEKYRAKAFEPRAYPYIKATGAVIETGAIVGVSALGGGLPTVLAGTYIGARTFSEGVTYYGDFGRLTTGQKIAGGIGLALGAAATIGTLKLGTTKFYSEWRNIIYQDLVNTPAKVRGKVFSVEEDYTRYAIMSERTRGVNKAVTINRVDVYQTGTDRIGFNAKGVTYTRVFNPETSSFINTREAFKVSGYIPDIKDVNKIKFSFKGKAINTIYTENAQGGIGQAIYTKDLDKTIKRFKFSAISKDNPEYFSTMGGAPTKSIRLEQNTLTGSVTRSRLDSYGIISKSKPQTDTTFIISNSNRVNQVRTLKSIYVSGVNELTASSQKIALSDLISKQGTKKLITGAQLTQNKINVNMGTQSVQYSTQETRESLSLPTLQQLAPLEQQTEQAKPLIPSGSQSPILENINRSSFGVSPSLSQPQTEVLREKVSPRLIKATPSLTLIPTSVNNFIKEGGGGGGGFKLNLDFNGLGLSSNIVKGGKKYTKYYPSFSALVFKIKGVYKPNPVLSKSGIDLRPILTTAIRRRRRKK